MGRFRTRLSDQRRGRQVQQVHPNQIHGAWSGLGGDLHDAHSLANAKGKAPVGSRGTEFVRPPRRRVVPSVEPIIIVGLNPSDACVGDSLLELIGRRGLRDAGGTGDDQHNKQQQGCPSHSNRTNAATDREADQRARRGPVCAGSLGNRRVNFV
jgi:hypothetical protein